MTLRTVVFATCDGCQQEWRVPEGYTGTPVAWDSPLSVVDLCDGCQVRIGAPLVALLPNARPVTPPDVPQRGRPTDKPKPFACSCGARYASKNRLTRHVNDQGPRHRDVTAEETA